MKQNQRDRRSTSDHSKKGLSTQANSTPDLRALIQMLSPLQQAIAQLNTLGFNADSRFYGRALLPRELQESIELRQRLGIKSKTVDFYGTVTQDGFNITLLKWIPETDCAGQPISEPSGSPKCTLGEGEFHTNGFELLRSLNLKGFGIYLYPNQGGRLNREIIACQSAYFESDDGSFDQQRTVIAAFGKTTDIWPTVIIKTRKSLHVYYRFTSDQWGVENWTEEIQRPLALAMRSDPAIQNTARLMRLAGFEHVKWVDGKLDFIPVTLEVCEPQRQYTRAQIKNAIASVLPQPYSEQRFRLWVYLKSPSHKDLGLRLNSDLALTCPDSELEETDCRWRCFVKLSRERVNGKDCDPNEAFSCDLKTLPKVHYHRAYDGEFFESDRNTIVWAQFLYGYNPEGRGNWITAQDPLIPESGRERHSIDSLHINKVTGAIKSHRGSDPKDIHERMRAIAEREIYKKLTQLTATPWKEINTPKLDLESLGLEPGGIYIVSSAKGTHKTNSLLPLIPKFRNVYAWFNRVALGREECSRIGVDWKDELKPWSGGLKVGFCADSSFSFSPRLLKKNGVLLVDEADQVFEHMFGDTCNMGGKRPLILSTLAAQIDAVIAGNGIALFMSADITDKEVTYINQLAPNDCPVRLIVNHYRPQLGDVYFYESTTPDEMVAKLMQDLEDNQPRFVIDDIKNGVRGCKSIAEYIRSIHPEWASEIVEINSDTSGDPTVIEYLKNINTATKNTRLLCCSPSVVSGVSIENGHFTEVYAFCNGILTISHASQAIARVRGAESIHVWAAQKGLMYSADRSLFPEQIKSYFNRNYEANCKHILAFCVHYNQLRDEWNSPHFDLYCKYVAYRNNCMKHLRTHLKERLTSEGYQLFSITAASSGMVAEGLKNSYNQLEINHAHAVATATILNSSQLQALENVSLTPEQKLNVDKTFLFRSFGQELIDNMVFEHESGEVLTGWTAIVLKDKRGKYRKKLEAFYLLNSDEETAITKDLKAEQRQLQHKEGRFAGDVRWFTRQLKARKFLGLHEFLNPDSCWSPADFANLSQKAKKHAGRIKGALGLSVQNMTSGQIFGELMGQLGIELDKKWTTEPLKNSNRYKLRQINSDSWRYAQMYVAHRQLLIQQSEEPQPISTDHPSDRNYIELYRGGDQAPRKAGQDTGVSPAPNFSLKDSHTP